MKNIILNETLLTFLEKGFEATLSKDCIKIEGFYKSGIVTLEPQEDGTFIAHSRYNQTNKIESFDDLVRLNYEWWQYSKNRAEFWEKPDLKWGNEMALLGLVKISEETVINYK